MKIAIVDDNEKWRILIEKTIARIMAGHETSIKKYGSGAAFIGANEKFDIVFMDVEMQDMDGFEATVLYNGKYPGAVVAMLTTHLEMSNRGYLVDAYRYISKENMQEEIREALSSFQKKFRNNKKLSVNVALLGESAIEENDILYIETYERKLRVHTKKTVVSITDSMNEIMKRLEGDGFYRCHQSYIVNLDEVKRFDDKDIWLKNGECIMLSKRQRTEFKRAYFNRLFQCANQ